MLTKEILKRQFAKDWKKHYYLEIFKNEGFLRKTCPKCRKNFWTLDTERELCGDPPCENYGFIGRPITRERWDYIRTWKEFEKFFVRNGHTSIPRYPVIDRWRPDLFFTIASIQDFQRIDQGNIVFEYPADPLIVPQVCLRFPDIPNIGVTGRHHSSFIMSGQHSFGNYWKDRCIQLNFEFLTKSMGIPEKELVYIEDVWAMPDFSAFGPCIETFSRGLELVNSVFMQFTKKGNSWKELPKKVIDVGWGHERLVWFSNGTHTGYDSVFGPVIKRMKEKAGIKENEIFERYSMLSGSLNFDEVKNARKMKEDIAKKIGISVDELNDVIEPLQALYAIADHVKTLLFAITDGGIPSNVGGGYNLRVILRRALSFISEFGFDFTLDDIAELHAKHLKPIFPELQEGLPTFSKIMDIEKNRYEKTIERAYNIVQKEAKKGSLNDETLIRLYTSNGITPEIIEKAAKKEKIHIQVPEDFYSKLTASHISGEKEEKEGKIEIDTKGIKKTDMVFYENPYQTDFQAKVLKASKTKSGNWVILDKTCFYPEGGGQPGDTGFIEYDGKQVEVIDTKKIGEIVLHKTNSYIKPGTSVKGKINWERRYQLMKMHTATHIIGGAARKVIGKHIWQAGTKKGVELTRIDLTHYEPFSKEETERIEKLVNEIIRKNLTVNTQFMPRNEAESKYGFVLYQGGASPGQIVRVVNVSEGFDAEACAGTHVKNTGEIEAVKIIRTERIQDGVNRIEFTCGKYVKAFEYKQKEVWNECLEKIKSAKIFSETHIIRSENVQEELGKASSVFSVDIDSLAKTIERFGNEINQNQKEINRLRENLGERKTDIQEDSLIKPLLERKTKTLYEICETIFLIWKEQRKAIERLMQRVSKQESLKLINKAKDNQIFEIVPFERKMLIGIANNIISERPEMTVILANQVGEIVGMSKTKNIGLIIKDICNMAGGSGGGNKQFGQGKAELSKLLKIISHSK